MEVPQVCTDEKCGGRAPVVPQQADTAPEEC